MNEVFRQEKKYLMNLVDARILSERLRRVMQEDEHNGSGGYRIRSLYFDTLTDSDYREKLDGLELRRKLRLRIYDPSSDFAMIEMKQKQGSYQRKRSLRITRADAEELCGGSCEGLLHYADPFALECYALMHMRCYRPKAVVEYRREAFTVKENRIRITLDSELRATESCMNLFAPDLNMYPVLDSFNSILEVKYDRFLLSYIKELMETVNRSEFSVSKYCLARSAGLKFGF